jgi:hypothetical protein
MTLFPGTNNVVGGFQYPNSGPNNTAEYMASGLPFVTASTQSTTPFKISFPYVTSEIYVNVSGSSEVRVGFSLAGVQGSNYFVIKGGDASTALRVRCKEIYVMAHAGASTGYSVMAAMTTIKYINFPILTGSLADPDTGLPLFTSSSQAGTFGYLGIG